MSSLVRHLILVLGVVLLLCGASAAFADSYQLTFTSGLSGVLNLTAAPQGGGSFLVTGVTGSENGLQVGGVIAPNSSGLYLFPSGDGFRYDDLLFPTSQPVFDNAGLLFTLLGSHGLIYENLYSIGSSFYLQSTYLNNGAWFPWDFSYEPVQFTLTKLPPAAATPEPSGVVLLLSGILALTLIALAKKSVARG